MDISNLILFYFIYLFQLVIGFFIIFIIPGFVFTLLLFSGEDVTFLDIMASTIVLSVAINILTIFSSNTILNIPINYDTITTQIIILSLVIFVGYLITIKYKKHIKIEKGIKDWQFITLIITLIAIFLIIHNVHNDYKFPLHTDEWQDIAKGISIIENENIRLINPYLKERPYQFDMEIGFNLFLAEFFIVTGVDPVLFYQYLPAISAVISSLVLFVFIFNIFKDFYPAFFSTIFFASLKSTIFALGIWFFVPMSMSIFFIYFILFCLYRAMKSCGLSFYIAASLSLLALTLIHPGMSALLYLTITFYLIFTFLKSKFNSIFGISIMFLLPFISFLYFVRYIWRGSIIETIRYFLTEFIIFGRLLEYNRVYDILFIYNFYGAIASVFAIAGIVYILYKKNGGIIISGLIVSIADILLYQLNGFTILLFYERIIYFALLFLVPLSGVGVYSILNIIFRNTSSIFNIQFRFIICAIVLLMVIYSLFSNYYWYRARLDRMITEDDYNAIKFLDKIDKHKVVMAHPRISDTIYPISRNYVVHPMLHSYVENEGIRDIKRFYLADCKEKIPILKKYDVDYVYFRFKIDCKFLREIYNKSIYIYSVVW